MEASSNMNHDEDGAGGDGATRGAARSGAAEVAQVPVAPPGGFALTGLRFGSGRTITLTWSPDGCGTVGGDPEAAAHVRASAARYEGKALHLIPAPWTTHDHLSSPYTALLLMRQCLDHQPRPTMTGGVPMLPDPPEGAVR
jgi:hypothetical protein